MTTLTAKKGKRPVDVTYNDVQLESIYHYPDLFKKIYLHIFWLQRICICHEAEVKNLEGDGLGDRGSTTDSVKFFSFSQRQVSYPLSTGDYFRGG
jgi:hypothetical protein